MLIAIVNRDRFFFFSFFTHVCLLGFHVVFFSLRRKVSRHLNRLNHELAKLEQLTGVEVPEFKRDPSEAPGSLTGFDFGLMNSIAGASSSAAIEPSTPGLEPPRPSTFFFVIMQWNTSHCLIDPFKYLPTYRAQANHD